MTVRATAILQIIFYAKIIRIALFLLGAYYKSNNKKLHTINQSLGNNIEHTKTNQSMFQITNIQTLSKQSIDADI